MLIGISYFLIKWLLYSAWCYIGIIYLKAGDRRPFLNAILLGFLRLLIGVSAAIPIWLASNLSYVLFRHMEIISFILPMIAVYILIYLPARWLEWGFIEIIIYRPSRHWLCFIIGGDPHARYWRLGGVIVSGLIDIPLFIGCGGIPLGRYLC